MGSVQPHPSGAGSGSGFGVTSRMQSVDEIVQLRANLDRITRASAPGAFQRNEVTTRVVQALQSLWDAATAHCGFISDDLAHVALAGVGSLGRAQMGSRSDLDLVLLHDGLVEPERVEALASSLWYPIWDAGLDLDHSVRSLTECRSVASADVPAAVGLLSVRPIAGESALAFRASSAVLADWRAAARRRLPELVDSAKARAAHAGDLAYLGEPDLKECRGGLRDAVLVDALAASWLTDRPHGAYDEAVHTLLDARDAVHAVSRRATNRLLASDLCEVAQRCGYRDPDEFLAVLAQSGRHVSYALDSTIRSARTVLAAPKGRAQTLVIRGKRTAPRLRTVAPGILEHRGELVLAADSASRSDPVLPLRLAATSARTEIPISPSALPSLTAMPVLPEPWTAEARSAFTYLIGAGSRLIPVWEALDLGGIWTRWIPLWERVRNRPAHAAVHRHTVDRHLVEVASRVAPWRRSVSQPPVLFLGALFHDIGKQPGVGDHSVFGAQCVGQELGPMGFAPGVLRDVQVLVRHHLLLSELAVGSDPDDPRTIQQLVDAVDGKRDLLVALRAITEADCASLAISGWTRWRAALVDRLYTDALTALRPRR